MSGTGGDPGFSGRVAKTVVASQLKIKGTQTPSPLLNQLFFGDFNKSVKSPETKFDWLTRDRDEVQKYIDDPFCGFIPTVGFFADLLEGLNTIHQDNEIAKIEKDLPFYFISGDQDPVGKKTKAVSRIINQYKKHGVKRIEYKFYKDGRHEMLNEINRQEVVNDIVNWLQKQLLY
ncbi:serine aminopeptidase domain-containing protein [Halalkalibacter akibai]|uniref:Lysophospholipase n=1 Tax=Halalkalibacter akibai (strain ATCC 43226 / DSM 21942 / CIP 109018 / JCM 9157 / 1139) TaxID=1236973 RepID=W4QSW1_HALA3|nr:alpha/beta hydrolase [Halalkalibacter akibai]GAE34728.1 lysophospholipase [Halalkalibacter akibai JCM 9157]